MENTTVNPVIDHLKKITLSIAAGTTPQKSDIIDQPLRFGFIAGLGPHGFTPFEYALVGKPMGDEIRLQLQTKGLGGYFRHINPPFLGKLKDHEEIFLTVKVVAVEPAESREVVRAMAAMTECECGCDCDCGC